MSSKMKSDEKYPLLYLIVDKDNGGANNNRKFFERRTGISAGATNVLEQWPGYLSTCWVSSLISILALLSMFILLMTALSTYKFHRIPRCIVGDNPMLDNSTIHLVHGPEAWNQHQLEMVEKIIQVFPNHRIHLILIKRQTFSQAFDEIDTIQTTIKMEEQTSKIPTTNTASSRKLLRLLEDPIDKSSIFGKDDMASDLANDSLFGWPFFDPRDFINTFLKKSVRRPVRNRYTTLKPAKITNIAALLLRYPSIFVEILTFEQAFEKSPLFLTWHHLNDETKIFAIRVLQLWQYGGLSFDLIQTKNMSEVYSVTTENLMVTTETYKNTGNNLTAIKKPTQDTQENNNDQPNTYVDSLLYLGYSNFQMIPGGIVTLAENGCHMETKSSCHSFFGEILINLKCGSMLTTPEDVIKGALKYYLKPPHRNYRRP